jgi:hypothetical protein
MPGREQLRLLNEYDALLKQIAPIRLDNKKYHSSKKYKYVLFIIAVYYIYKNYNNIKTYIKQRFLQYRT